MTILTSNPTVAGSSGNRALTTAVLMSGAAFFLFILFLPVAIQASLWQLWLLTGLLLLAGSLAVTGVMLIRRNQIANGIRLAIAGHLLLFLVAPALLGQGFFMGVTAILLTVIVASRTVGEKEAREAILAAVLVGIVAIMLDILWPGERLLLPRMVQVAMPALSIAVLLALILLIIRQFAGYTVRVKLITTFLAVSLFSLAAVTYFSGRTLQTILTDQAGAGLQRLAHNQALAAGNHLVRQIDTLQSLSLNRIVYDGVQLANTAYDSGTVPGQLEQREREWQAAGYNEPIIQERLTNNVAAQLLIFGNRFTDHASLLVTDRYGGLVGATSRTPNFGQAQQPWWQATHNDGRGRLYIGQPEFNERTGSYNLILAIPILAPNSQQVVGILASSFRMKALADLLLIGQEGESGQAELYLPSGLTLQGGAIRPRQAALDIATLSELHESDIPYASQTYREVSSLVSAAPVKALSGEEYVSNLNWTVVAHQSRAESLAAVQAQEQNTLFLALGVALGAAAVAVATAQLLTNPITRLNEAATRIAAGDFWAEAAVESRDEIGHLATTFNGMTAELRRTLKGMEERSRALSVSAEVSRRLSTILDHKELVAAVVQQVQEAFNYYHVHIYLYDDASELFVLTGGTGEASRAMLAAGHKIGWGRGLVGTAAAQNQVMLAPDTSREKDWLPNPLLPDTKAEVAVPIARGDKVLGVLDVQHNVTGSLGESDAALLQSIADQVAIALQNAYLFAEVQRQMKREALVNAIGQKIQNAATIETVLESAAQELGRALGAPTTRVRLNLAAARNKEQTLESAG